MKLIADSGSTKTSWILMHHQKQIMAFETIGMNPFFTKESVINSAINEHLETKQKEQIKAVHFFGAGCSNVQKANELKMTFESLFKNAQISIKTDIEGAVLSVAKAGEKSIVSILGTGSSFRIFDGKNIVKRYSSLGFIIGDEGSGTYIAKALLRKIFYQQLPDSLVNAFFDYYHTSYDEIIENTYSKPNPNKYLAQFTQFCALHIHIPEVENIVLHAFDDYFVQHIVPIKNHQTYRLHFIGSIAYYFQKQLEKIAYKYQMELGNIVQKPIHRLAVSI